MSNKSPNAQILSSVTICDIEKDGTYQLQLDKEDWGDDTLSILLPNNKLVCVVENTDNVPEGEFYAFWGENGRLYLSGKGFKASEVVKRLIGHKLMLSNSLLFN